LEPGFGKDLVQVGAQSVGFEQSEVHPRQ
jgi:hypothetical protein